MVVGVDKNIYYTNSVVAGYGVTEQQAQASAEAADSLPSLSVFVFTTARRIGAYQSTTILR